MLQYRHYQPCTFSRPATYKAAGRERASDMTNKTPVQRFEEKYIKSSSSECWEWQGKLSSGYGKFRANNRNTTAHRYSYELYVGLIPNGLHIDHLCRNRACVNPSHLEPVTAAENTHRGMSCRKRFWGNKCRNGHIMTEENVYRHWHAARKRFDRSCKLCIRERQRLGLRKKKRPTPESLGYPEVHDKFRCAVWKRKDGLKKCNGFLTGERASWPCSCKCHK